MEENSFSGGLFQKEYLFINTEAQTDQEVLSYLSEKLENNGMVKKGYGQALLKREKEFPTGLPLGKINIAIPHTDAHLVMEQVIAVIVLKNPVAFKSMEDKEESIPVKIVICLVMSKQDANVKLFPRLLQFFTNEKSIDKILVCKDEEALLRELRVIEN